MLDEAKDKNREKHISTNGTGTHRKVIPGQPPGKESGKGRGSSEVRAAVKLAACGGKALSGRSLPPDKKNEMTAMNSD